MLSFDVFCFCRCGTNKTRLKRRNLLWWYWLLYNSLRYDLGHLPKPFDTEESSFVLRFQNESSCKLNLSYENEFYLHRNEHVAEHIFKWMVSHDDSFWHRGKRHPEVAYWVSKNQIIVHQLRNGLDNTVNQSKVEVITCSSRETRGNECERVKMGVVLAVFFFTFVVERTCKNGKPFTFRNWGKSTLSKVMLRRVLYIQTIFI